MLPAALRERFGLGEGARVFVVPTEDGLLIVPADSLVTQMWANNQGGDAGDAGQYVREARHADLVADRASTETYLAVDESLSAQDVEDDLFAQLESGA